MELYHISLNNLRRRKIKVLFVLLGIIIGISTIVSVYGVVETMKTEMTRRASEYGVNVTITPDAGSLTFSYGGITLPEIMYDVEQLTNADLNALDGLQSKAMIKNIAPKLFGMGDLDNGHRVIVVGAHLPQEFSVKPWMRLENDQTDSDSNGQNTSNEGDKKMDFEFIDLTRQELERLEIEDNQVFLGKVLAKNLNLKEGDYLNIGGQRFEVKGILLESGSTEDQQIFMNLSAAQDLLGRQGEITVIDMAVDYTRGSEEVLLSELKNALPHTNVSSLRQEALRRDDMLNRLVRFGVTISVIVLLVGMLVVGLTMTGSVRERTREIGVFRAIGFRKSHIFQLILLEGVLISLVGGLIGFFAGSLIARFAGPYFAGMDIKISMGVDILFLAMGLAVLIGVISSLYPAYKAAEQDPVEALRFI